MENRVKDRHVAYMTRSVEFKGEMLVPPCVKDVVVANCKTLEIGECATVEDFGISLPKHLNRYRIIEGKEFIRHNVNLFAHVGSVQGRAEMKYLGVDIIWERVE